MYLSAGKYPKAMEEIEKAKRLRPESSEPHMLAARIYLSQDRRDEAMKEFLKAVRRGVKGSHPIVVNIETSRAVLKTKPEDIKSVTGGFIKLKDGSRFRGEISLETK